MSERCVRGCVGREKRGWGKCAYSTAFSGYNMAFFTLIPSPNIIKLNTKNILYCFKKVSTEYLSQD